MNETTQVDLAFLLNVLETYKTQFKTMQTRLESVERVIMAIEKKRSESNPIKVAKKIMICLEIGNLI